MSAKKIVYPVTKEKIKSIEADYIILNGGRNCGKSYSCKLLALEEILKGNKFAYIRRYKEEITDKDFTYFGDIPINTLTKGEFDSIGSYQKKLYLQKYDEKSGKFLNVKCVGEQFCLSNEDKYRSRVYKDFTIAIFEEFITTDIYLNNETDKIQNLASTILRSNKGRLYLIGNLTTRNNPYFREWELTGALTQALDTTDFYTFDDVKIAVYRSPNGVGLNKMTFGHSKKAIDGVEYTSTKQPHLEYDYSNYEVIYNFVFEYNIMSYLIQLLSHKTKDILTLYVQPKTTPVQKDTRLITNQYTKGNPLATKGFVPLSKGEMQIFDMIKTGNICFSDNLTGTEFNKFIKLI